MRALTGAFKNSKNIWPSFRSISFDAIILYGLSVPIRNINDF